MKEIEVGEYVRIDKSSRFLGIGKIIRIVGNTVYVKMYVTLPISFPDEEIKKYKHSKNILDLIEVEDFVNGYRVIEFKKSNIRDSGIQILVYRNHQYEQWETIFENEIKNILTKEQYNQNCYRLEKQQ